MHYENVVCDVHLTDMKFLNVRHGLGILTKLRDGFAAFSSADAIASSAQMGIATSRTTATRIRVLFPGFKFCHRCSPYYSAHSHRRPVHHRHQRPGNKPDGSQFRTPVYDLLCREEEFSPRVLCNLFGGGPETGTCVLCARRK